MQSAPSIKEVYDENDYKKSKKFARKMDKAGKGGILYDSVRNKRGGECLAIFTEVRLDEDSGPVENIIIEWDGEKIVKYSKQAG